MLPIDALRFSTQDRTQVCPSTPRVATSNTAPDSFKHLRLFARSEQTVTADSPLDGDSAFGGMQIRPVAELSESKVRPSIERALSILEARRAAGWKTMELQLVVQAFPSSEQYARWRKDRHRLLQRSNPQWGTFDWPERMGTRDVALLLLPYPAGRVGPAIARTKLAAQPMFINGPADTRERIELLASELIRVWVHGTPADVAAVLGPPVLEELQGGRVNRRSVLDCGLSWPLPAPDGL